MSTTKRINSTGLAEINKFLLENHKQLRKNKHEFSDHQILMWAEEAEESANSGNAMEFELPAYHAVNGHALTYRITDAGFDLYDLND